jgi:hypothetical protein
MNISTIYNLKKSLSVYNKTYYISYNNNMSLQFKKLAIY